MTDETSHSKDIPIETRTDQLKQVEVEDSSNVMETTIPSKDLQKESNQWKEDLTLRLTASDTNAQIMNMVRTPSPQMVVTNSTPPSHPPLVPDRMHRAARLAKALEPSDTSSIVSLESDEQDGLVKRKRRPRHSSPQREFKESSKDSSKESRKYSQESQEVLATSLGNMSMVSVETDRSEKRENKFDPIPPDSSLVQLDPTLPSLDLDRCKRALQDFRAMREQRLHEAPFIVISRSDTGIPTYTDVPRTPSLAPSKPPSRTPSQAPSQRNSMAGSEKHYGLPFRELDNSLMFHLKVNVLQQGEEVLDWLPCSFVPQSSPYLPDDMVTAGSHATGLGSLFSKKKRTTTHLDRDLKELPCWILTSSERVYLYQPTFTFPFAGVDDRDGTRWLDPTKFMQLQDSWPFSKIARIDVGWEYQTVTIHFKVVVEKKTSFSSFTFLIKDTDRGKCFVTALKKLITGHLHNDVIPPEALTHWNKIYNAGGWWSSRNCKIDLDMPLQSYKIVGWLRDGQVKSVVLMKTEQEWLLVEQRWDVWPPLLFPPEVVPTLLGDASVSTSQLKSTQALNAMVGKQLHKGLLVDFVGEWDLLAKMSREAKLESIVLKNWQFEGGYLSPGQATLNPWKSAVNMEHEGQSWQLLVDWNEERLNED